MLDFIINNYYVILVICILLIFAIIGYIVDTMKQNRYMEKENARDTYIPEEEVFIQKIEAKPEENKETENNDSVDELLEEYNNDQKEIDSNS